MPSAYDSSNVCAIDSRSWSWLYKALCLNTANGATSAASMRLRIYPDLDPRLHGAAEIQIAAHLIKLVEDGRVIERGDSYAIQ